MWVPCSGGMAEYKDIIFWFMVRQCRWCTVCWCGCGGAPSRPELRGLPLQTRRYRIRRVYHGYGWQSDTLALHCPTLSASPSVVVTNLHSGWGQMYILGRCPPLLRTHTSAEDIPFFFRLLDRGCLVRLDPLSGKVVSQRCTTPRELIQPHAIPPPLSAVPPRAD
jgi:hypothetical protein